MKLQIICLFFALNSFLATELFSQLIPPDPAERRREMIESLKMANQNNEQAQVAMPADALRPIKRVAPIEIVSPISSQIIIGEEIIFKWKAPVDLKVKNYNIYIALLPQDTTNYNPYNLGSEIANYEKHYVSKSTSANELALKTSDILAQIQTNTTGTNDLNLIFEIVGVDEDYQLVAKSYRSELLYKSNSEITFISNFNYQNRNYVLPASISQKLSAKATTSTLNRDAGIKELKFIPPAYSLWDILGGNGIVSVTSILIEKMNLSFDPDKEFKAPRVPNKMPVGIYADDPSQALPAAVFNWERIENGERKFFAVRSNSLKGFRAMLDLETMEPDIYRIEGNIYSGDGKYVRQDFFLDKFDVVQKLKLKQYKETQSFKALQDVDSIAFYLERYYAERTVLADEKNKAIFERDSLNYVIGELENFQKVFDVFSKAKISELKPPSNYTTAMFLELVNSQISHSENQLLKIDNEVKQISLAQEQIIRDISDAMRSQACLFLAESHRDRETNILYFAFDFINECFSFVEFPENGQIINAMLENGKQTLADLNKRLLALHQLKIIISDEKTALETSLELRKNDLQGNNQEAILSALILNNFFSYSNFIEREHKKVDFVPQYSEWIAEQASNTPSGKSNEAGIANLSKLAKQISNDVKKLKARNLELEKKITEKDKSLANILQKIDERIIGREKAIKKLRTSIVKELDLLKGI